MHEEQSYVVEINPVNGVGLKGPIAAAASKSSMQRACAAALVANRECFIKNPGHSNDDKAALDIISRLGAIIEELPNGIQIRSNGVKPISKTINCGESGLSIRMFTPLVALSSEEISIEGSGSLQTRPMDFFDTILPLLGVSVKSNDGKLPLQIRGPLQPKSITVDGSLSSQFLTGLLLAYAASNATNVSISVTNLKSRPYIDLTLDVIRRFGLPSPQNKNYEEFYFAGEASNHTNKIEYTVEGDWSGAAFLLVAGAIAGPLIVTGLDVFSTQADKAILQALIDSGVGISIEASQIELRPKKMNAFHFNATDCPDLFPPLVALASYCEGKTIIEGVSRLAHKESNRGLTLQQEFGKMGIQIDLQDDLMIIHGGKVNGGEVHSHHDHRIAMACAIAALKASGETTISAADAVNKSYPDFFQHLQQMGVGLVIKTSVTQQT
ncbi:MAG: 3-phosphoshikimate 1-carboxyvinyltransferase [Chitinophagaceae bacterium]|nr:3-phosphoshikimate 1-carboxyvinyltransferase [Chitinophagaceae bacterium]